MKIAVIGCCNIDITATIKNDTILYDSNPGKISFSMGGVGRNIAHNLCLLNQEITLFTVLGSDMFTPVIEKSCKDLKMNMDYVLHSKEDRSSIYLCINDKNGALMLGSNDMEVCDKITTNYVQKNIDIINQNDVVIFDTNLTEETIEYILNNVTKPLFVDTVSYTKAKKLGNVLANKNPKYDIYSLKTNDIEVKALFQEDTTNSEAAKYLHAHHVKNVCISMGKNGVYYSTPTKDFTIPAPNAEVVNTTGSGDSFLAGMVYAYSKQATPIETLYYGAAASKITLESMDAVSNNMSEKNIKRELSKIA